MSKELEKALNVPFTFSQWCRSGLANYLPSGKCNCWRCLAERGEEATEETNALAEREAKVADEKYNAWISDFLAQSRKARIEE